MAFQTTGEERVGKAGCLRLFLGFVFFLAGAALAVTVNLVLGLALMAACVLFIASGLRGMARVERSMRLAAEAPAHLDSLTRFEEVVSLPPEHFEKYLARLFRALGYEVLRPKGNSSMLALRRGNSVKLAQWVHPPHQIPSEDVRALWREMLRRGADGGFFATAGVFTELARRFAEDKSIEIMDGAALRRYFEEVFLGKKSAPAETPAKRGETPFREDELEPFSEDE